MSQTYQSGQQSNQTDPPEAPNNSTQDETQKPPPIIHTHRDSTQDPTSILHTRRVSAQEPPPISHTRRVSIQEPPPISHTRRVSIQEPRPSIHTRRVSIQEPIPYTHSRRASVQEPSSISNSHQVSIQETPSISQSRRVSIKETPSVTYSSNVDTQNVPPGFQTHHISVQRPWVVTHTPLTKIESLSYTSEVSLQDSLPTTWRSHSSFQSSKSPTQDKVDVPPSITHSPEASIESIESISWTPQENSKVSLSSSKLSKNTLESTIYRTPANSLISSVGRFEEKHRRRPTQLSVNQWMVNKARLASYQLSLGLTLAGMVIMGLISVRQPWIHFRVPLTPPGDPADPLTIPINTIFFERCHDIFCLHEQDYNAYLLDFAWAFFIFASLTGLCLCFMHIGIPLFASSSLPILLFSNVIISILTGTNMILSILFYLMQASHYLQEGMTYRLGCSFYMAWTGVFFFLMSGFFSYLNYIDFWFMMTYHTIWT